MLRTTAACRRRIVSETWALSAGRRWYAQGRRGKRKDEGERVRGKASPDAKADHVSPSTPPPAEKPRLIEQLFPERYAKTTAPPATTRHIPPIPPSPSLQPDTQPSPQPRDPDLSKNELMRRAYAAQPPDTSVLVLRNASKNLVEEDFRRVIPQGKHLEGWTLEQGDILRVIPGRDLETLEPTGSYYLLFSSPLSAWTYQGHVKRIQKLVATNVPSSLLSSPIPPPPGYTLEGVDVHDAINSYTLLSPDQRLQLRQLKPPLAPAVRALVKHGGYEQIMTRKGRMPFEARLAVEGPQLQLPFIRHVLRTAAQDRGIAWSGTEDESLKISQWQPVVLSDLPSPASKSPSADLWAENLERRGFLPSQKAELQEQRVAKKAEALGRKEAGEDSRLLRRTPQPVYVVGFETERALQSFVHFWHQRPLTWPGVGKGAGEEEGDAPPMAHVQVLW